MVSLKSLWPAGARTLVRRLLRRPSPAGNDEEEDSATSTTSQSTSRNEHDESPSASTTTLAATATISPTHQQTHQAKHSDGVDKATMAMDIASPPRVVMPALRNKENVPPNGGVGSVTASLAKLHFGDAEPVVIVAGADGDAQVTEIPDLLDPVVQAERAEHLRFTGEALDMARLALRTNETPVGCVLVHDGKVVARGMNATNVTRNGTRHAEFMAISALLSYPPKDGPRTTCLKPQLQRRQTSDQDGEEDATPPRRLDEGNEDGSMGHLYPYGQKCHPSPRVDRSILRECTLYVTVEPCVMCASFLRQLGIKKVYFGAVNDKFGGTGGVFSIHANSLPVSADGQTASAHPTPKPTQLPDGSGALGVSFPRGGGDGGNVEQGYEIEGGWGRDEAVGLLRRFYVQENGRAPVPRKKEGRAARLAALLEEEKDGSDVPLAALEDAGSGESDTNPPGQPPNGSLDELDESTNRSSFYTGGEDDLDEPWNGTVPTLVKESSYSSVDAGTSTSANGNTGPGPSTHKKSLKENQRPMQCTTSD
ncbi:hypothetical protein S7711_01860 [Stachybotrys chartarum IBT 7711]|uniref:CMP/dCMP-type deaminase domain-containing protein n=1 Tax=Stachybotrys chartarum (strain CBS 109288 / IBT 7711) TaxID=1280523 RepID=A0A084AJ71_STACB|nr:hypothetical protein S7711_01860 [Stachybotrys chartarum IBT 7711]